MRIFRIGMIIYRLSNKDNVKIFKDFNSFLPINMERLHKEFKEPCSPANDRYLQRYGVKHFYDGEIMFNVDCDLYKKE